MVKKSLHLKNSHLEVARVLSNYIKPEQNHAVLAKEIPTSK